MFTILKLKCENARAAQVGILARRQTQRLSAAEYLYSKKWQGRQRPTQAQNS